VLPVIGTSREMITEIPHLCARFEPMINQVRWSPFEAGGTYANQAEGTPSVLTREKAEKFTH
jgi:hypothetical protein